MVDVGTGRARPSAPAAPLPDLGRGEAALRRAREAGCELCSVCKEPIRGAVVYQNGAPCHFGCKADAQSDTLAVSTLLPCQYQALDYVRQYVKNLHVQALPRLRERAKVLGFAPEDVDETLAWIRLDAPVLIHVDLAKYGARLARDTHYRNQFETGTSGGALNPGGRISWESAIFGTAYDRAAPEERCKYGVLNVTNDPQGVPACSQYGKSYLLLKGVRLRTTFSAQDTSARGMSTQDMATVDFYAHVLEQYSDEELRSTIKVGTRRELGTDSRVIRPTQYKEAQIHGEVRLSENVEVIMVHPSLRGKANMKMLQDLAATCNAPIIWIETSGIVDEVDHMLDDHAPRMRVPRSGTIGREIEEQELARALEASRGEASILGLAGARDEEEEEAQLRAAMEASLETEGPWVPAPAGAGVAEEEEAHLRAALEASLETAEAPATASRPAREEEDPELKAALEASLAFDTRGEEDQSELELALVMSMSLAGPSTPAIDEEPEEELRQAMRASLEDSACGAKVGKKKNTYWKKHQDGPAHAPRLSRCEEEKEKEEEAVLRAAVESASEGEQPRDSVAPADVGSPLPTASSATALELSEGPPQAVPALATTPSKDLTVVVKASLGEDLRRSRVTWNSRAAPSEVLHKLYESVARSFGYQQLEGLHLEEEVGGRRSILSEDNVLACLERGGSGPVRLYLEEERPSPRSAASLTASASKA